MMSDLKHTVTYELNFTRNLGNFENIKINVGLAQEGYGHPNETLKKVREWVEKNLATAVDEVVSEIQSSNTD